MGIFKIILNTILVLFGIAMILIVAGHFGLINTLKPYIVQSGSMAPGIPVGSFILVRPGGDYNPGDIITFKQEGNSKKIVTHRIVSKDLSDKGQITYRTKGDNNKEGEIDKWVVLPNHIIGKVYVSLPYLGFLFDFAKKPFGFIILVIIPATIIIYEELKFLKQELTKFLRRKRVTSSFPGEEDGGLPKATVFVPLLGGVIVLISFSGALIFDVEKSQGNLIRAAVPTPTPITNHLVINEVYYDPDDSHKEGDDRDFEWVEIYNPTGSTVNLKNWKIVDNFGPERTISESDRDLVAGDFVILAKADNVRVIWGIAVEKFIAIGQRFGNGLANGDDRVILKDDAGSTIDQMSYGTDDTSAFDPSAPDVAEGHSLERDPDGADTDSAADFVDRSAPSPGS